MNSQIKVAIIMGSISDMDVMQNAARVLDKFGVGYELAVVSAHRSPEWMFEYGKTAGEKGLKVIIAGAGGAAHLPGMMAAITTIPVIGVPVVSKNSINGLDSLFSIVQMPADVPVATVAVNGAHNAGILAVQILAIADIGLSGKLVQLKIDNIQKVHNQNTDLQKTKQ